MKKSIFFVCIMALSLGASTAFAAKVDPKTEIVAVPAKSETKLSENEINSLRSRVEEIRSMDKSNLTVKEKRALNKELRSIRSSLRSYQGYVYVGGTSLLLIVILLIILL